jgi:SAM-dependent methyltransferase
MLVSTMTTGGTKPTPSPTESFLALLREAIRERTFIKLTLSSPCGPDKSLVNVFIRPVTLQAGERLSFVYRHKTRDITRNLPPAEALAKVEEMLGAEFQHAHLFTTNRTTKLELRERREPRLVFSKAIQTEAASREHDRTKSRFVESSQPWLHALGVTGSDGRVARGMEAKFRQINKFVEILASLLGGAGLKPSTFDPCSIVDMGCGKGYLTFAAYDWLNREASGAAEVRGIESRADLVELCNRAAQGSRFAGLKFETGDIARASVATADVLIALHACDTATDDAIAKGIAAGAKLILVAPCCHKELRPQIVPPPVFSEALRHGILLERQAEFVTDALRAALLEWAGYDTKVFEFISVEHTARNLMIAATLRSTGLRPGVFEAAEPGRAEAPKSREAAATKVRELAAFYGIRSQRLAQNLNFPFTPAG